MRGARGTAAARPMLVAVLLMAVVVAGCGPVGPTAAPGVSRSRVPSASPSPAVSPSPSPSRVVNAFSPKVPAFPATPTARPVPYPPGPLAPVYRRVPTKDRVAFITIDDGDVRLATAAPLLAAAGVPTSQFLIASVARRDPAFFTALQALGSVVQNHTVNHPSLRGRSYEFQRREICGAADALGKLFGTRPTLFRPPYGNYDDTTRRAAHDCGMKAVLYWRETVDHGKVFFQTPKHQIEAGDIILMHFRPAFVADFLAALKAIHDAGLTPARLEDYLG